MTMTTARSLLQSPVDTLPPRLTLSGVDYMPQTVLRQLPGRRCTLLAHDDGQPCVLKLFVARGKGQAEFKRELRAHRQCSAAGIAVAPLQAAFSGRDGVSLIRYAYLDGARSLAGLTVDEMPLDELFSLFAACHEAGCEQQDPHADNFVLSKGQLYLLDLASVRCLRKSLGNTRSLANLAALIAQWPLESEPLFLAQLPAYCARRGWQWGVARQRRLARLIRAARTRRQRHYLKKQFRNCSLTRYYDSPSLRIAMKRALALPASPALLPELQQAFEQGEWLKQGNSASVKRATLAGQQVVIKRYNVKHGWHFLRRCLRPSRASVSWRNAHLLEFLGIRTPSALLFVESRFAGLRRGGYFVCRHVDGRPLSDLDAQTLQQPALQSELRALFAALARHRIWHGDLKANNLLVDEAMRLWLIDLDALQQLPAARFAGRHRRDTQRFLRNWPPGPLQQSLARLLDGVE